MHLLKKLTPVFAFLGIFIYVLFFIPAPKSWIDASTFQILVFFLPILGFFTFLIEILMENLPKSFALGLGLLVLTLLYTLSNLTSLTLLITLAFFIPFTYYLPSTKSHQPKEEKIPGLSQFQNK